MVKMFRVARSEQLSQESGGAGINNTSSIVSEHAVAESGTRPTTLNEAERSFKIVFYCFLFIFGSSGNVLVIAVVKGKPKRTVNDFFILNSAAADLTFLWCSVPFYTYELFQTFEKNMFYCKFIWPLMSVTLSVSVSTLTSMSIERCRGITNPLQPRIKLKATLIWILLIWIVAFVAFIPLMIVAKSGDAQCAEGWPHIYFRKAYTAVLFGFQYVIPLMIIITAYLRIAFWLMTTRLPMRTAINSRGQIVKQKTRTENVQIIQTLAVIVFLFMACMLPNQIAWLLVEFGGESHRKLSEAFWTFAGALIYLHACVNPIVYGTLTHQFRKGYVRYFVYVFCCRKKSLRSRDTSRNDTTKRKNRNQQVTGCSCEIHGSLKEFTSAIERRTTTSLDIQSSPELVTGGKINQWRSPSTVLSPSVRRSSSIVMPGPTCRQHTKNTTTLMNLSFCNQFLDVSYDDEKIVEDAKL
ncbi:galanin receptor type 1-like [Montipora foliosa]|uniref:galanin receptor type 1-like n=1 Tax=Montipora foliosa TaxID=591990 RepID=UPI0035F11174